MNPLTVSAQYAAFVWFTERPGNPCKNSAEALRFARENWQHFLPLAHEGLGRLLLKLARPSRRRKRVPAGVVHAPFHDATASPLMPRAVPILPFSRN
jgi:hypothetical protein